MTDIIELNVGGTKFSTSRQTLTLIPDSFFSSLLSGRIASSMDTNGAIFIDRDPVLFNVILNYMRSQQLQINEVDVDVLKHEAEYYGISPLVKRLELCGSQASCGDILFHCSVEAPNSLPASSPPGASHAPATAARHAPSRHEVSGITGQLNWIACIRDSSAYLYRMTDQYGCQPIWSSADLGSPIFQISVNARPVTRTINNAQASDVPSVILAVATGDMVMLWLLYVTADGTVSNQHEIGGLTMKGGIDALFFAGGQLVALQFHGAVGVWHSMTQNWQVHDTVKITSYDTAGTLLLLGGNNGSIYNIDMHKFPLRMKDNDLLISEMYRDPNAEGITALSLYLTPKTSTIGNWIEIAYGTDQGTVRIITEHPETLGQSPQLFQTFSVHTSAVVKVMLSHKHLISVCEENQHVRTWDVTRFRGMISTQPGSIPLASFNMLSLHSEKGGPHFDIGPFGEKDSQQLFIQAIVPSSNKLFVRLASSGQRVCEINAVDSSPISSYFIMECEGNSCVGRYFLFTGHLNSSVQIWDMSTALDLLKCDNRKNGSPNTKEILQALEQCKLTSGHSVEHTPMPSPYTTIEKNKKS